MSTDFVLPELGENIETIEVVKLLINPGDAIVEDQPVLELETDKAAVEVPSTLSGVVKEVHVGEGDEISVGQVIFSVEVDQPAGTQSSTEETPAKRADPPSSETPPPAVTPSPAAAAPPASDRGGVVEFTLPELGENIDSIEIVKVMVKPGDTIAMDQVVLELETDKAAVEVPSSVEGVITEVCVQAGDAITVGDVVFKCSSTSTPPEPVAPKPAADSVPAATAPDASDETPSSPAQPAATAPLPPPAGGHVPAAPSVRKFAREIGIDITQVSGSGPQERISVDDVKRHSKQINEGRVSATPVTIAGPRLPEFEKWGDVRRERMSGIRRKTAQHMANAWSQIPHVTVFDTADVTQLEDLRKRFAKKAEEAGGKLTMGAMIVKVAAQALRVYPNFNASIDMEKQEIIYKNYCNVGVAVDTERGLLVPVIRNTDEKSMIEIAVELLRIAEKARAGKIEMREIEGGTFTVTNLGRTCGTFFTPMINYPEVAILGVGRMFQERDLEGNVRKKLPLSLSFDHRIIDGAESVRFLGWIIEALDEPLLLSLDG